jgi:GABA(A) receptor-associated protein
MSNPFQKKYDFETRKKEADKIKVKYPNRYPIIVNKSKKCDLDDIERSKFLVPGDLTMGQFIYIVRKRIKLTEIDSLYLFINKSVLPTTSSMISTIYDEYKDKDGFLYIEYCNENVFG